MAARLTKAPAEARRAGWLLLLPAALLLALFFLVPLGLMVETSLRDGFETYVEIFTSPVYGLVLGNTVRTAVLTTVFCLLLAYPYAYVLTRVGPRLRLVMLGVVLLPFWTSLLVRSFAWVGLLQDSGILNQALQALGLVDGPLQLIRTPVGVLVGMVHVLLPYMVLPLVNTMGQIDGSVLRAASSLGAGPLRRFARVFLPLSVPGVLSGSVLVLVLSLGFYITPALLGGARDAMIGETIVQEVTRYGPVMASALGLVLLVGTLISLALLLAVQRIGSTRRSAA
ncbi:ABC transporter permease [Leucobacter weissii]|uniref:ABC transporter permease n=1 Tax=Leucobacter weissii TaxID=1983706 RepID=A0A939SB22_9MICO|nr:ABC transporter permease [Leucobacter weissii]MBO1900973.1 ABC transporter permease [Leucobacter weissii]